MIVRWTQYTYYVIIGVVSLIMLIFMPMLGTEIGLEWNLPDTKVGWIVWATSKTCSASFNVLIFHCFNKQGKQNSLNNENFKEAKKILLENDCQPVENPRSPNEYSREIYTKKGTTIFLTTALGAIGLGQAILTFNPLEFIVQLISLIVGLIFGFMQMKATEEYFTQEYLEYAKNFVKKEKKDVQN